MTDTTVPAIAAGSKIEVNGALFTSATETAITGSPSDGAVYIYIDPSGPSAVFTNTAPMWSDSKQGWYGTSGTANCRYVETLIFKISSAYYKSIGFIINQNFNNYYFEAIQNTIFTNSRIAISYNSKTFDVGNIIDISTGVVTIPKSGIWTFSFGAQHETYLIDQSTAELWINGSIERGLGCITWQWSTHSHGVSFSKHFDIGDTVRYYFSSDANTQTIRDIKFTGFLNKSI
jgi:hypothetical protein